ncbi:uncharacterized protein LODBEIA_P15240 [Lodderomyces beijingensis]|uniref:Receptor L-domain domain-containing protein n=1 Tax=Lodderomyces beijingensis TaxID=1775926 RepID=A0ABP0ZGK1_9ASCO
MVQPVPEDASTFESSQVLEQIQQLPEFNQLIAGFEEMEELEYQGQQQQKEDKEEEKKLPPQCRKSEIYIHSLQDLNNIIDCETIVGDIIISEFNYPIITLTKLNTLKGNLTIFKSPELVRIESPHLTTIDGWFKLFELTSLALISFPSLKKVQVLCWEILPILSNVQFHNEIQGIESITISDTSLTGFSGFLTNELKRLDINNNRFMDNVECNVETISEYFHLSSNSKEMKVNLPNLKNVKEISIKNVDILQLENLEKVENSMKLQDNYFKSLKFPKLKLVGGTLNLAKNSKLVSIDTPQLEEIAGGLMIINNAKISKVNSFPNLKIIGGALEVKGAIDDISLKEIKLIKGSAIVASTSPAFDCGKWAKSEILLVVRGGKIECTNANNEKTTARTRENGGKQQNNGGGGSGGGGQNGRGDKSGSAQSKKNNNGTSSGLKQAGGNGGGGETSTNGASMRIPALQPSISLTRNIVGLILVAWLCLDQL